MMSAIELAIFEGGRGGISVAGISRFDQGVGGEFVLTLLLTCALELVMVEGGGESF